MTMTPLFLSNSASAKAIDPSSTPSLIRGRPDLKVSITSLDQNICSSYASGSRWIIVNYTVTNIGMYTSSEYYAAVFIDGNFWA